MAQQTPQQSITVQLTHDLVVIGDYTLNYWEGVRGKLIQCRATVGIGPGLASILNVTLEPTCLYYLNTQSPFMHTMHSGVAPVTIPAVTSLQPIVVPFTVYFVYPGLVVLRITAKAGGTPVPIHSMRGVANEFDAYFYVVEREAAIQTAVDLGKLPK